MFIFCCVNYELVYFARFNLLGSWNGLCISACLVLCVGVCMMDDGRFSLKG